mmetsp:Transcript_76290/g.182552  ORF Transcript_76290/g.182552 Transcript_76290/m.182552 type:complete len:312 (-) Transcript_76290:3234-4169(-)
MPNSSHFSMHSRKPSGSPCRIAACKFLSSSSSISNFFSSSAGMLYSTAAFSVSSRCSMPAASVIASNNSSTFFLTFSASTIRFKLTCASRADMMVIFSLPGWRNFTAFSSSFLTVSLRFISFVSRALASWIIWCSFSPALLARVNAADKSGMTLVFMAFCKASCVCPSNSTRSRASGSAGKSMPSATFKASSRSGTLAASMARSKPSCAASRCSRRSRATITMSSGSLAVSAAWMASLRGAKPLAVSRRSTTESSFSSRAIALSTPCSFASTAACKASRSWSGLRAFIASARAFLTSLKRSRSALASCTYL